MVVVGPAATPSSATGGRRPEDFDAAVAAAWFDLAFDLVRTTPGFSPPVASRALAYAGLTVYEAVVPGSKDNRSLSGILPGLKDVPRARGRLHWPTVANASLATIMRAVFGPEANQASIHALESAFALKSAREASRGTLRRSTEHGRAVAGAIFQASRRDGGHEGHKRNFPPGYVPPVGPGLWVPTPPAFQSALQPTWGGNRCFAIANGSACPPGDPTAYSNDPASRFHREAIEVYDTVNHLTAEQEAIARFWSDDPGQTATPPGHSISVATQVLRAQDASLMAAAETYAKVGIAVCDAFIACWNAKYRYNLLRPVTYIQREVDPDWLPLLTTPPFPEYPSGHSVQSGAAFSVLADLFGDRYSFVDHTHDRRGFPPRRYRSFSAAAKEAAISRLFGGIHFRPAIELGLAQRRCIGKAIGSLPFRDR